MNIFWFIKLNFFNLLISYINIYDIIKILFKNKNNSIKLNIKYALISNIN